MLEQNDRVVILDFGIASWASQQQVEMTETQGIIGSPHYMSPEQFAGDQLDQRTDIYSLGVLAFELFTGSRPFVADSVFSLGIRHTQHAPPNLIELRPDMPPRLAAIIMRCLAKKPEERFSTVTEVIDLMEIAEGSG